MTLTPMIEREEIVKAYETFVEGMSKGATSLTTTLGWQGGNTKAVVFWHESLDLWSYFDPEMEENRYWCAFGVEDPSAASNLDITCEINPPKKGINRRLAGQFVRDSEGKVYITHSGKLGGGRKGIGKNAFRQFFKGDQFVSLNWQDGKESETFIIGKLDDFELPKLIAHFVHEAKRFKEQVTNGIPR